MNNSSKGMLIRVHFERETIEGRWEWAQQEYVAGWAAEEQPPLSLQEAAIQCGAVTLINAAGVSVWVQLSKATAVEFPEADDAAA